jgi:hypothetical protein
VTLPRDPAVRSIIEGRVGTEPARILRADDQLVRARAAELLADAAAVVTAVEAAFRAQNVAPPTREHPFPPDDVMRAIRRFDALRRRLHDVSAMMLALETPASDAVWDRLRSERSLLQRLLAADGALMAGAEDVLDTCRDLPPADGDPGARVEPALAAIDAAIRTRRQLLG